PDRSIVDQDVDPAKLRQCPGGQRLDLGSFADVGEYRDRFDPKIPGLTRDGLGLLLIGACVNHDMRAFTAELQHGRSTDIAPRSGDQRDFPFELAHAPIPPAMLASDPASFDPDPPSPKSSRRVASVAKSQALGHALNSATISMSSIGNVANSPVS